jgi:hypothetical protein
MRMQGSAWIALLRLIPAEQIENLALALTSGTEISIQSIIRFEPDYFVIRGRLVGTTDEHAFFIVPFDRINHVTLQRSIKEPEVRAMFGDRSGLDLPREAPRAGAQSEPGGRPLDTAASMTAGVDKASLLERLRARRSESPRVGTP